MVLNVTETVRLIRDGDWEGEKGGMEVGKREIIYLSLHCHHQNDFCWLAAMRAILMFQ